MCEGGEGPTDHILPPQQLYSGAKVHQKAARPGTQAVKGPSPGQGAFSCQGSFSKYLKLELLSLRNEDASFISSPFILAFQNENNHISGTNKYTNE